MTPPEQAAGNHQRKNQRNQGEGQGHQNGTSGQGHQIITGGQGHETEEGHGHLTDTGDLTHDQRIGLEGNC